MRISDWSSDVCSSDLCGAPRRGEVVGTQPVLPDDDRISRDRANLLDEPAEMEDDPRIGGQIGGDGRLDGLSLAELVDLNHPGHAGAASQIGRAHDWTPVTHAKRVCRLLLEKKTEQEP